MLRKEPATSTAMVIRGLFGTTVLVLFFMFVLVGQGFAKPSAVAVTNGRRINEADLANSVSYGIQLAKSTANITTKKVIEEPSKYNLASVHGGSSIVAIPSGETEGVVYFYNVDGNQTTHITLEVGIIPYGWEVEINPPLRDMEVSFGGNIVTVAENLHVEPTELLHQPIENVPDGMGCITLPNKLGDDIPGYTLAKMATIIIRVTKSEQAVTMANVRITAMGSWLGQTGSVDIIQTRDFVFQCRVLSN